jgi:hypothetical protein
VRALKLLGKLLAAIVLGIVVLLGVYIAANWQDARNFPKIISSYYAKEACSCLYVLERDEAQCHEMVRQYVPISAFENDKAGRKVSVRGLGRRSVAAYIDDRHGCRLTE